MAVSFNPMHYLKHAWESTNTVWGKLAIILFYTFIWFQIIWAIQILVAPTAVMECFIGNLGDYSKLVNITYLQQVNLFTIGFLLYADRGGIKVWNTCLVAIVFCIYMSMIKVNQYHKVSKFIDGPTCEKDQIAVFTKIFWWTFVIWPVAAFLCSVMESMKAGGGSSSSSNINGGGMPSVNPMYYLKHAWTATHSIWGKLTIIFFYVFIWFQIISGIVMIFNDPTVQQNDGNNEYYCYFENMGPYGQFMASIYVKQGSLIAIGFLLLADRGGIKLWNVLMVAVVFWIYMWIFQKLADVEAIMELDEAPTCDETKMMSDWSTGIWCAVVWPAIFVVFAALESRAASAGSSAGSGGGTTDETTPLTSA